MSGSALTGSHCARPKIASALIQLDGSKHWWFEERGPQCPLLVYIDDATSEPMHQDGRDESAFGYMDAPREYIERHGKPVASYSDKHSVFRNNRATAKRDGMTQYGRALDTLNTRLSVPTRRRPRVESSGPTPPCRTGWRRRCGLPGLRQLARPTPFLAEYISRHNQRFAKTPFDHRDLHRPLAPHDNLTEAMVWREERTFTAGLTLHYNKVIFLLEPNAITKKLARKRATVRISSGGLQIQHEGRPLPYLMHDTLRRVNQAAIVDNKHLDAALAMARAMQEALPPRKRNNNEPSRKAQPGAYASGLRRRMAEE